jgi:hypothetical protein
MSNLAYEISVLVHNQCKDVPHDIGLQVWKLIDIEIHNLKTLKDEAEKGGEG